MTDPGHSTRACQPLFIACEHYWHPILIFRLIAHRYRCQPPASPLPPQHEQIFLVLRVWLQNSSGLFVSVPGLALELRTFLASLFALGGVYRITADELGQLAVKVPDCSNEPYLSSYNTAKHEILYQVRRSLFSRSLLLNLFFNRCLLFVFDILHCCALFLQHTSVLTPSADQSASPIRAPSVHA